MRIQQLFESMAINLLGKKFPEAIPFVKYLHQNHIILDQDVPRPVSVSEYENKLKKGGHSFLIKGSKTWASLSIEPTPFHYIKLHILEQTGPREFLLHYSDLGDDPIGVLKNSYGNIELVYEIPYRKFQSDINKDIALNRYKDRDLLGIHNRDIDKRAAAGQEIHSRELPAYRYMKPKPTTNTSYMSKDRPYYDIADKTWKLSDRIFRQIKTDLSRKIRRGQLEFTKWSGGRDAFDDLFNDLIKVANTPMDNLVGEMPGEEALGRLIYDQDYDEDGGPDFSEGMYSVWLYLVKEACRRAGVTPEKIQSQEGYLRYQNVVPKLVELIEKYIRRQFFK